MDILEDYRFHPGTKLKTQDGREIMVLKLCTGMIRYESGAGPTGGLTTVAVADLRTGVTTFEDAKMEVEEIGRKFDPWRNQPRIGIVHGFVAGREFWGWRCKPVQVTDHAFTREAAEEALRQYITTDTSEEIPSPVPVIELEH